MGQATKTDINQGHTLVMMSCIYYVSQLPNEEAFRVKCRESLVELKEAFCGKKVYLRERKRERD